MLTLDRLASLCGQQTALFYHGRESDPRFCFEIFRRAIHERDQSAWELIPALYGEQVARWVRRHPSFSATGEEEAYFVNGALEKLWQAVPAERFASFQTLSHLLSYLQLCVFSVITDHLRGQRRPAFELDLDEAETSPDPAPPLEAYVEERSQARGLWQLVAGRLHDQAERELAYEAFALDLKPAEIIARHPGRYADIKALYRAKENLLDRLRRDKELQNLFGRMPESRRKTAFM